MTGQDPQPREEGYPPYSYVSGRFPHPLSHPDGHSHGAEEAALASDESPDAKERFALGVRLFDRGYYWESHEAWEAVWKSSGDEARRARVQALIKLAAAAVKGREQRPEGVRRHLRRAVELLASVAPTDVCDGWMAVDWPRLLELVRSLQDDSDSLLSESNEPVVVTVPFTIPPC